MVAVLLLIGGGTLGTSAASAAPIPLQAIGGASASGAGQISYPNDVTVDDSGHVWVADAGNARIDEFASDGSFIQAFGLGVRTGSSTAFEVCTPATGCQGGQGGGPPGAVSQPSEIVFDAAGHMYVAESGDSKISEFDVSGTPTFMRAFGWGVATGANAFQVCTTVCQTGVPGGAAGQLQFPFGMTMDSAGRLYVADTSNGRIDVYDVSGTPTFLRAFGWDVDPAGGNAFEVCTTSCQAGKGDSGTGFNTYGGPAGQMRAPQGIALDAAGHAYVPDFYQSRVNVFDLSNPANPTVIGAFGGGVDDGSNQFENCTVASTCGNGFNSGVAGVMFFATDIAFEPSTGFVAVSEYDNQRVEQFDVTNSPTTVVRGFGWGVASGSSMYQTCTPATGCQTGLQGTGFGQFDSINGLGVDCKGALWVADVSGTTSRVQRFGEPGTAAPNCAPPAKLAARDTTPPDSKIGKKPKKHGTKRKAKFTFSSTEPGSTFMCKLDKKKFKACTSPFKKTVKPGKHSFKVEAIDAAGNADASPAAYKWKVLAG